MRYLYGDSTESNLAFDYLAFLREVMDAAVVMVDCEVKLATTVETRRTREGEAANDAAGVEELGRRATQVVAQIAEVQSGAPVARCAAAIASAIRDAVEREAAQTRTALATARAELDKEDDRQRTRAKTVLEKLLRAHDLPDAERELGVTWTGASGVRATMRMKTPYGIEAVLVLDIPPGSVLGVDLRVDRIAEGVEVHAFEAGGWLKKGDKLVAHKLGRYAVAGITIGSETIVRLRSGPDPASPGLVLVSRRTGDLTIQATGEGAIREVAIDDRDRPGLRTLVDKLEAAARSLGDTRTALASIELDGKPIAQCSPRALAERLIAAIAPTVQQISRHSRSPGELVLRRLIADNRREELFVSTADLLKKLDPLPAHGREVFAPLGLDGSMPASPHAVTMVDTRPTGPVSAAPVSVSGSIAAPGPVSGSIAAPGPVSAPIPVPIPGPSSGPAVAPTSGPTSGPTSSPEPSEGRRPPSRTGPPPLVPMPEKPVRMPSPPSDLKRMPRPPARLDATAVDAPRFEDTDPPFPTSQPVAVPAPNKSGPTPSGRLPATLIDKPESTNEALGKAIEAALDEEEANGPQR